MLNKIISYVDKEEYTKEEINDYIEVINIYLRKEKVKSLEKELRQEIDPIKDLIPVCHNCHHIIHSQTPPISVEAMRKMIKA